jgi:hypothetical protein
MNIKVKNSQLNNEAIQSLNALLEFDINAGSAFKLTRIIKEISSIVDDKLKLEKKIFEKWVQKDEAGNPVRPKDESGNIVEGAVNITNVDSFTQEMSSLMEIENEIPFEKVNFDDLQLTTVKIKDLLKLDFLFN